MDGNTAGGGNGLGKELVLDASATHVDPGQLLPGDVLQLVEADAVLEGDALSNQAQNLPFTFGNGLPRFLTQLLDPLRHPSGGFQVVMIRIDERTEGRGRFGLLIEFSIGGFVSLGTPLADTFLEKPRARDITEEAGGVLNALLVCPSDGEGLLGKNWLRKLGA